MRQEIELYGAQTGNCIRAAIALEEAGLPYVVHEIDLRRGQQHRESFLALNAAGKVPVMVDHQDEDHPFILCQSNAIMFYAAERSVDALLPSRDPNGRARALERFFYFVTDVIAPNHAGFYLRGKRNLEGARELDERMIDGVKDADRFVRNSAFMAGNRFTIADISAFTIIASLGSRVPMTEFPNLERWFRTVEARPSVIRGYRAFSSGE